MRKCTILFVLSVLWLPARAAAENYAFLVGVSDYDAKQFKPLAYARSDILEFRDVLLEAGMPEANVVLLHDDVATVGAARYLAEAEKIRDELRLLIGALTEKDTLLVAFAGHGVQFKGEAESYFCPLDVDLEEEDRESLIAISEIYDRLKNCPARRKLLLVDACRNDPQSRLSRSRGDVELESVTSPQLTPPPEGVVALFSCAPGQEAFEHPDLEHGVFFYHVLQAFRGEENDDDVVTLDELLAYTKRQTAVFARLELGALQTPRQRGFFEGEWILREIHVRSLATPFTAAEAREAQQAMAAQLDVEAVESNSLGMELVLIPPGEFTMGVSAEDVQQLARLDPRFRPEWSDDAQPRHRVRITRPFFLAKYEVTRGEFSRFVADEGYRTNAETNGEGGIGWNNTEFFFDGPDPKYNWQDSGFPQNDRHPVVNVSWIDAVAFCRWLSEKEGREYRLPSSAEWEYACRAGTESLWYHGDDPADLASIANVADAALRRKPNGFLGGINADDGAMFTAAVGRYDPNAWGLFDMHGNVSEWCGDWYDPAAYSSRRQTVSDPVVTTAPENRRVTRGGAWDSGAGLSSVAFRAGPEPDASTFNIGFRVVTSP